MLIKLLICCFVLAACQANVPPTEQYLHQADLDSSGKMFLYWKFTETHITFELHGNTVGWVGMGISPNGAMTGADINLGWVKDGVAKLTDRHGIGNTLPPLDPEQNVELLDGMEENGWTVIKFRRQIASCEPEYDLPITSDTLKIIYAFGDIDPEEDDVTFANYHNSNRGVRSLILLEMSGEENNFPDGEIETHKTFDLLNDDFEIPAESTYYNCRLLKIPEFAEKEHVVIVAPVVQPGHEMFVHHMLVYQCIGNITDSLLGTSTRCFGSNMPPDFLSCSFVIQAWSIGGGEIYYPKHTGFPLGESDSPTYVVLETHYDNPRTVSGVRDSSGLRFTHTHRLRQYDAGIFSAGHAVTGIQHIIPPNDESFLTYGECSDQCMKAGLSEAKLDSINVFGVLLHSHLLGTGLTVRHIRNKTELPYISKDNAYDFNYQETRRLSEERQILPGDSIQVVCNYKTKGVRNDVSVGGLDTQKEMCTVFVYYYPKISMTFCETAPRFQALLDTFGVQEVKSTVPNLGIYNTIYDLEISQPDTLAGQNLGEYLSSLTWNDQTNQDLEDKLREMPRIQNCRGIHELPGAGFYVSAPEIDVVYVEKTPACSNLTFTDTTTVRSPTTTVATPTTSVASPTTTIATPTTSVAIPIGCLDGVVVGNTCYKFLYRVGVPVTYEQAGSLCAFHGMGLAEIATEEVYEVVYEYVQKNWLTTIGFEDSPFVQIWLGSFYDGHGSVILGNGGKGYARWYPEFPSRASGHNRISMEVSVHPEREIGGFFNINPEHSGATAPLCQFIIE